MASTDPIAFFDSGVGLFSVLAETKKILPLENYVIFADQGHNPYGEKTEQEIISYTQSATRFLLKKHKIKILVLACNTATVLALGQLRKKFDIPIIGTVPAVKPAFLKDKNTRVAIMSTPATAKSKYLKDLIRKFGQESKTLRIGCAGLEEAIEVLDLPKIEKLLLRYLPKIQNFGASILVLGCTHYPLIKRQIKSKVKNLKIIDSGKAIAKQIQTVLWQTDSFSKKKIKDAYYTTGDSAAFSKIVSRLLQQKIKVSQAKI